MPMTRLIGDARRAVQESSVAHPLFMYDWSPICFVMKVDLSVPYKVIACVPRKGKQIGKNSWQVW